MDILTRRIQMVLEGLPSKVLFFFTTFFTNTDSGIIGIGLVSMICFTSFTVIGMQLEPYLEKSG